MSPPIHRPFIAHPKKFAYLCHRLREPSVPLKFNPFSPAGLKYMAKASFIMHGARGRVGNVVGYQREGQKLMRSLPTSVKNPQTDAQTLSRLALSSAAKTAQHLRGIVDHSFQGVKYGQTSVNHFASKLAKEIRSSMESAMAAGSSVAPFGTAPVLPYLAGGVACGAKMLISSGDLVGMPFSFNSGSPGGLAIGVPGILARISLDQVTPENFAEVFGVPITDQITFVIGAPVELDYISETELFYGCRFAFVRLNFIQDIQEGQNIFEETTTQDIYILNPDFVDWDRTSPILRTAVFQIGQDSTICVMQPSGKDVTGSFSDSDVCLAGVIISRYENNAWRRSTTRLIQTPKSITQSAVAYEQNYGYNDIESTLALSVKQKGVTEDRYLNKELNG